MIANKTCAAVVAILTTLASPVVAQQIGTSSALRGDVFLTPTANPVRRSAQVGEGIALADRVETRAASTLQVSLLDRSTFTVGQNASLLIDRFIYDPDRDTGDVAADVARGAFRFISGRVSRSGTVATIDTPAATIGIRGTFLEGLVGPNAVTAARSLGHDVSCGAPGSALFVALRGPASDPGRGGQITIGNTTGQRTLSRPNQSVFAGGPNCPVTAPRRYAAQALAVLDAELRTRPTGPSNPIGPVTRPGGIPPGGGVVVDRPNRRSDPVPPVVLPPLPDGCDTFQVARIAVVDPCF